MAKSKRKQKLEAQNKKEARQAFIIIVAITLVLLLLGFLMFWSNL